MAKKHAIPYRLYQRGETYHAYISYVATNGQRFIYRGSTKQILPEKASQFCIDYINKIEEKVKLTHGHNEVEISFEQAGVLFFENVGKYHQNAKGTLEKIHQLKPFFNKTLSEISHQDLMNYVAYFRDKGRKPSTINRNLTVLSSIINFCQVRNYHTPDVKISLYKQKEPDENIQYLENWQIAQKIVDRAASHLKPIILTALYTGMRKGNILGLKWENLDFTNDIINIQVKDKNKVGGKNLSIPIIPPLKEILRKQPRINDYVFNFRGHPITQIDGAWHNIFYVKRDARNYTKILKDKSLPYITFHTLRHTAATWILKETGNLRITQEILGHANIKTTLKYAHVLDKEKREALSKVYKTCSK